MNDHHIVLVGCGKMGGALLNGWLSQGLSYSRVTVVDHHVEVEGVSSYKSLEEVPESLIADIIVLAVKPQMLSDVTGQYAARFPKATFISIAAGKGLDFFSEQLGRDKSVIRVMPNLPVTVGMGVTVGCANTHVTDAMKDICAELFTTVGSFLWLDDESQIDAVTAVSGSGPAYVFYFIESFIHNAVELGLPIGIAKSLAIKTIVGSVALAESSDEEADTLRKQVTSPGGTTEAALQVLMDDKEGLMPLLQKTMKAAKQRSEELAG